MSTPCSSKNLHFLVGYYTNDLHTDKGKVGGSSPPRPTKNPQYLCGYFEFCRPSHSLRFPKTPSSHFDQMQHCYILIAWLARPQLHLLECRYFKGIRAGQHFGDGQVS
jgi:hypothetical protein